MRLGRFNGPGALSRYWNALVDRRPAEEVERLATTLDADTREIVGLVSEASRQTPASDEFATRLHESLMRSFQTSNVQRSSEHVEPAQAETDLPIHEPLVRRLAPAGQRSLRLAAALLIVVIIGLGAYQLYPSSQQSTSNSQVTVVADTVTPPSTEGAGTGINIASVDGQTILNLSPDGAHEADPAFSPDGAQIVFSTGDAIWVMNADGSGRRKVAEPPNGAVRPRWSPSGEVIAFLDRSGQPSLINQNGSNLRSIDLASVPITPAPTPDATPADQAKTVPTPLDWVPTWARDGQSLAVFSAGDGVTRLFIVSADGSRVSHVASVRGSAAGPVWSPDGASIAFNAEVAGGWVELMVVDVETLDFRILFEMREVHSPPAWSPDGRKLLVTGGVTAGTLVNADGTGTTPFESLPTGAQYPTWSPDGSRIAFIGDAGEVYIMNTDGTELQSLAKPRGTGQPPSWSPDGGWIVFSSQG